MFLAFLQKRAQYLKNDLILKKLVSLSFFSHHCVLMSGRLERGGWSIQQIQLI